MTVAGGGTQKYWYDALGNLDCITTNAGSRANCSPATGSTPPSTLLVDYGYDKLNRLASYRSFSAGTVKDSATYSHDALDRVLTERETHSGSSKTTEFTYLGLSNLTTSDKVSGSENTTRTYSYDAYGHRIGMRSAPTGKTPRELT